VWPDPLLCSRTSQGRMLLHVYLQMHAEADRNLATIRCRNLIWLKSHEWSVVNDWNASWPAFLFRFAQLLMFIFRTAFPHLECSTTYIDNSLVIPSFFTPQYSLLHLCEVLFDYFCFEIFSRFSPCQQSILNYHMLYGRPTSQSSTENSRIASRTPKTTSNK